MRSFRSDGGSFRQLVSSHVGLAVAVLAARWIDAAPHGGSLACGGGSVAGCVGISGGSWPRNTSSAISSASLRVSPTMGSVASNKSNCLLLEMGTCKPIAEKPTVAFGLQLCRVGEQKAVNHRLRSSSIVQRRSVYLQAFLVCRRGILRAVEDFLRADSFVPRVPARANHQSKLAPNIRPPTPGEKTQKTEMYAR